MAYLKGSMIHDTYIVLEADESALKMFRATRHELIGSPFIDLFAGESDLVELERLRLQAFRERDAEFSDLDFTFRRFDNTLFVGRTVTRHINASEWQTTIDYLWDTGG